MDWTLFSGQIQPTDRRSIELMGSQEREHQWWRIAIVFVVRIILGRKKRGYRSGAGMAGDGRRWRLRLKFYNMIVILLCRRDQLASLHLTRKRVLSTFSAG